MGRNQANGHDSVTRYHLSQAEELNGFHRSPRSPRSKTSSPMTSFFTTVSRFVSSITFLSVIIISIPISFDVGGRDCGLAFSLFLSFFYFFLSILRLSVPSRSKAAWLVTIAGLLQYLAVPALLIYSLERFGVDEESPMENLTEAAKEKVREIIGVSLDSPTPVGGEHPGWVEKATIIPWNSFLTNFTLMFQLVEGFCSLLVIQSAGQISRWLVNQKKSDSWMIALLVASGTIITSAFYFVWRIYTFPALDTIDATLIGVTLTCAVFLCGYGIASGRGNAIESSLLFSYVVLCMYEIFTDYKPNNPSNPKEMPDFPPLPPAIMSSFTVMATYLPLTIKTGFKFLRSALSSVTSSVLVALAFRLSVLNASTKIIPAVREGRGLDMDDDRDEGTTGMIFKILRGFSPVAMIAVYTNLLMTHFESMRGNELGQMMSKSGWINILATMALYAFELQNSHEDSANGSVLTKHWKTD